MLKKTLKLVFNISLLLVLGSFSPSYADLHPVSIVTPIEAEKNASKHNNLGCIYFKEKDYFAAIKEYRIAIGIDPNSQSTATYFNNLGKVYLILGEIQVKNNLLKGAYSDFSKMAERAFEEAIKIDCMKIEYYKNLVKAYELIGNLEAKKQFFLKNKEKNAFNVIPASIILVQQGNVQYANMLLDDFVVKNPDLIITNDLKKTIKENLQNVPLIPESL